MHSRKEINQGREHVTNPKDEREGLGLPKYVVNPRERGRTNDSLLKVEG